jgi:hypothetical protein
MDCLRPSGEPRQALPGALRRSCGGLVTVCKGRPKCIVNYSEVESGVCGEWVGNHPPNAVTTPFEPSGLTSAVPDIC